MPLAGDGPRFRAYHVEMASCGTQEPEEQECVTVVLLDDHELVRRVASPTVGLSPQGREVLGLVGEGLNARRMAVPVGLAEKTVKLESRTQAAILGIKGSYDQVPVRDLHLIG